MLFIILGLSFLEIITGYVLENGIPLTTKSYKSDFFYDIKENNTNKILNGSAHINYKVYILNTNNYFSMYEITGHDKYYENGYSRIHLKFNQTEKKLSFNFSFIPKSKKSTAVCFNFDITVLVFNITITVNEIGKILILENGISQNITNLLKGQFYYILISTYTYPKNFKNANITLSMNYNPKKPFEYLTIYEHNSLDSNLKYTLEIDNQVSFNKVEDKYLIKIPYIISLPDSDYISFKIIPEHNIDYINAKVDNGGNFTYISYKNTKFSNLTKGYNYGYYMNAREKQLAKFNITINYMKNIPFEYINILETSETSTILKKTKENVKSKYKKINDTYVIFFEYNLSFYKAKLISLDIALKYDIENLTLYKEIDGGAIDCKNDNLFELRPTVGYPFYLYIKAKERQIVSVEGLVMEAYNTRIINDIYLYEFLYRNSSSYNYYQKISDIKIDFPYKIKNVTTNYIALYFVQVSTFSPIHVKLTVSNGVFDCINGTNQEYNDLRKYNNYYFYINATVNKYVSIKISMEEKYRNSLKYMTIYEYPERYNYNDILQETSEKIIIRSSKNEVFSYTSYKVISNLTNFVCFRIYPDEKAKYNILVNVKNYNDSSSEVPEDKDDDKPESDDSKSKSENNTDSGENKSKSEENKSDDSSLGTTTLVMIILGSIIFIIIIIFIVLFILKKSNKLKSSDIINMEYSPIQNAQQNELK